MEELNKKRLEKRLVLKVCFLYGLYKQSLFVFISVAIILLAKVLSNNNVLVDNDIEEIVINSLYIISGLFFIRMIYGILYFKLLRYELYKDRLATKEGVFTNRLDFLELYRVKDYRVYQSLFMRLFRMMNITLITSDKTNPVLHLKGIPKSNVFNLIRNNVEDQRRIKGVREFD